ncbi:MAG: Amidase [Pseudonocardiales bacterium]|nr:Amidase [Pseudonocardiales bacterium]
MADELDTIAEAAGALRSGATTSVSLIEESIARADRLDPLIGCYITRLDEHARADALQADRDFADGIDRGPLQGVPFAVKDLIATADAVTTAQSSLLKDGWSDREDAEVIRRLRAAGAVLTGKTTLMEFAVGFPPADGLFPMPRNPWAADRWPGGSSSGSASGVAAGLFPLGIGTDTGGSLRVPAALCGVTGLKPTFGRVPKSGVVPFAYSLDHVGPIARTAEDCAIALQAMAGPSESDTQSSSVAVPNYRDAIRGVRDLSGVRIGVVTESHITPSTDPAVVRHFNQAVTSLVELGADIVEMSIPYYDETRMAAQVLVVSESLAYHLPDLRSRWDEYLPDTRAFLSWGAFVSGADYVHAQRIRRMGQRALATVFETVDLIATPTVDAGAPTFARIADEGPAALGTLMHTPYWDAVGNPAIALPMGSTDDGMPVSLHLAGRPFDETLVLRAGHAFQSVTTWHLRKPSLAGDRTS